MINKHYQHLGYGTEALKLILNHFRSVGAKEVKLSFEKSNCIAEKLYAKCGFTRNEDLYDGEIVMVWNNSTC